MEKKDEQVVQRNAFGELLAMATENVVALAKLGADAGDLTVRNLRLAGRRDMARLGQQLARTEDKLETVLQEVERLQDELRAEREEGGGQQRRRQPHAQPVAMNPARAAVEFANTLLTTEDAEIGDDPARRGLDAPQGHARPLPLGPARARRARCCSRSPSSTGRRLDLRPRQLVRRLPALSQRL